MEGAEPLLVPAPDVPVPDVAVLEEVPVGVGVVAGVVAGVEGVVVAPPPVVVPVPVEEPVLEEPEAEEPVGVGLLEGDCPTQLSSVPLLIVKGAL